MRIVVTGGAGLISSDFARYVLNQHPEHHAVVLDALTYPGNLASLKVVLP